MFEFYEWKTAEAVMCVPWAKLNLGQHVFAVVLISIAHIGSATKGLAGNMLNIAVSCKASQAIKQSDVQAVCGEILVHLAETFPAFTFRQQDESNNAISTPAINLSIDALSKTALALKVVWVEDNGTVTDGMPLRFAVFDREIDADMRRGFYTQFFDKNPIPF